MAEYFKIGEFVGIPPAGKKVILCDTDGSFKSMDSAGTKTAIGGGGGGTVASVVAGTGITVNSADPANPIVSAASPVTDWIGQQFAHAVGLNASFALVAWQVVGFAGWTVSTTSLLGGPQGRTFTTGASTQLTAVDGGAITLACAASANNVGVLVNKDTASSAGQPVVSNMKSRPWYMVARVRPNAGFDTQTRIGISLAGAGGAAGIEYRGTGLSPAGSATNWTVQASGGSTPVDTGVALDTVNFHDIASYNNPTVAVNGYVDRVAAGTLTDLSTLNTNAAYPLIQVGCGTSAAVRGLDVAAVALFVAVP